MVSGMAPAESTLRLASALTMDSLTSLQGRSLTSNERGLFPEGSSFLPHWRRSHNLQEQSTQHPLLSRMMSHQRQHNYRHQAQGI